MKTNQRQLDGFKIMAEFVSGFEKMTEIGPCVSIFGSARLKEDHKYYQMATEIAEKITELGFGVITGGGPGIMEAGNRGAHGHGKIYRAEYRPAF